jgi:hypothetical protein
VNLYYADKRKKDLGAPKMKSLKLQLLWTLLTLSLLTGCGPLEDLGKGLGDLFKGITIRFP